MPSPIRYLLPVAVILSFAAPGVARAQVRTQERIHEHRLLRAELPALPVLHASVAAQAKEADEELIRVWGSLPSSLRDELLPEQRAWAALRHARCYPDLDQARDGHAESMLYRGCILRENRARTAELLRIAAASRTPS